MKTIQVRRINTNPFAFTIAFEKNIAKTQRQIINSKDARVLKIPGYLTLIDMFQNEVFMPIVEIDVVADGNMKALLAWDIISMMDTLVSQIPPSFRSTAHLFLAAASLEKINDFPQCYLDKALDEIDAYEKGDTKLENSTYVCFLIEEIKAHIYPFLKEYLMHLNPNNRETCLNYIQNLYQSLSHIYETQISSIDYHPNEFDV